MRSDFTNLGSANSEDAKEKADHKKIFEALSSSKVQTKTMNFIED